MNRSRFVSAALLGLALLSVDMGRGQLFADELESIDPQPKSLSTLLDMIGDWAHGAFNRCDLLGRRASAEQTAYDADASVYVGDEAAGEVAYATSAPDETADAATETRQYSAEEDVTQYDVSQYGAAQYDAAQYDAAQYDAAQYNAAPVEVARQTDDYDSADENPTSEDAVNPDLARASVPPAPSASTDEDYADCQDQAAAPAGEEKAYENYDTYDGEWNAEPAPVPVAAAPVGDEAVADEAAGDEPAWTEVTAPADYNDAYLDESQPAIDAQADDTLADDVARVDYNRLDRRALLSVASLLDRLGIALQRASQELTSLAAKHTGSIGR